MKEMSLKPTKRSHIDIGLVWFAVGIFILTWLVVRNPNSKRVQPAAVDATSKLRIAYFPNIAHASAIVAVSKGKFQSALGGQVQLETRVVNAGPEAMEAMLAGEVDIAFVGPSPAINTFLKSGGTAVRLLAGASSGGAALVARKDANIRSVKDLAGKKIAVPQLGGTQDVSCRMFLAKSGLSSREKGGSVEVLPVKNPDILTLFKRGELDAAWVPEPWASRLISEANGKLVIDERDLWPGRKFTTTVVVVNTKYLKDHKREVEEILSAHVQTIKWLNDHPADAQSIVNSELKRLTGKAIKKEVLASAWSRVNFTSDSLPDSIETFAKGAFEEGYLKGTTSLAGLFESKPLENARRIASVEK